MVMKILLLLCSMLFTAAIGAAETGALHPKLEVFRPYLGQYWQGNLAEPGSTKAVIDRSHWFRALNGQAIKTVHSINHGEYGGESFIFWDEAKNSLAYYYFTTAGFYTYGTMQFNPQSGEITALENVENNQNGITQVKSHSKIMPDGTLEVRSTYLQNEQWVQGHSAVYQPVAPQEIIFK
tara:strand:- start:106594 stop:107133 length:540 start_codon:yes stop_codon:yes gene_type:complete